MFLSAVSVLVVAQSSSEVAEGLMNNPVLIWMFRKWDMGVWTGSNWLRIGTGGGHL